MNKSYEKIIENQRYTVFRLISIIGGLIGLSFAVLYSIFLHDTYNLWPMNLAIGVVLLGNVFLLQWHKRYEWAYAISLITAFISIHISTWYTGGISSPALFYEVILVLGTYLFFNRMIGRIAVIITMLDVLFFFFFKNSVPLSIIPADAIGWNDGLNLMITLGLVGAFAYALDVSKYLALSQLKHSNQELRDVATELENLSIAISNTDNSIMITNAEGKIEWVNNGFIKLTGYSLEDVQGTHGEILRKEGKTGFADPGIYQRCIDERRSVRYTEINVNKWGQEYWLATTFTPIFSKEGELKNFIAIDTDVTDRKLMEEELKKAKEVSEESIKNQREFISNVSREIQSPLHGMISMSNLLASTELSDEQRTFVETMSMAANTLNLTLNDILDLSKIRNKQLVRKQS